MLVSGQGIQTAEIMDGGIRDGLGSWHLGLLAQLRHTHQARFLNDFAFRLYLGLDRVDVRVIETRSKREGNESKCHRPREGTPNKQVTRMVFSNCPGRGKGGRPPVRPSPSLPETESTPRGGESQNKLTTTLFKRRTLLQVDQEHAAENVGRRQFHFAVAVSDHGVFGFGQVVGNRESGFRNLSLFVSWNNFTLPSAIRMLQAAFLPPPWTAYQSRVSCK